MLESQTEVHSPALSLSAALSQKDSVSSVFHTRQMTCHVLWFKNTCGGAHKEMECLPDIESALKILASISIRYLDWSLTLVLPTRQAQLVCRYRRDDEAPLRTFWSSFPHGALGKGM